MEFDFTKLPLIDRYKLMTALVVPRPIAWVTSISALGVVNVAPFSFFNVLGTDPVVFAIGIGRRPEGGPKDTLRNIEETGEFVINLVTYGAGDAMNRSAAEFPPDESEAASIGLETIPSKVVRPPRLALSPVQFECRRHEVVAVGNNRIVLGVGVHGHLADEFYDPVKGYVATERLDLIGRMHGRGWYTRTSDLFELKRVSPEAARKA